MTIQLAVRLPEEQLAALDAAIGRGAFPTRAAAVRKALELLLRAEREREIEDAYRRGYGEHPQEAWIGETGLAGLGVFVATEEQDTEPL